MGIESSGKRVTVLVLVALGITAPVAADCPEAPVPGDVVINEILFVWPGSSLEFVELYNRSSCEIDAGQLTISDSRGTREPVPAGAGLLAPGHFFILAADSTDFMEAFGAVPEDAQLAVPARWPALNNGGDAVMIAYREVVLDSVSYQGTWAAPGRSLERRNPDLLRHTSANWGESIHSSGATPGTGNSIFHRDRVPPSLQYVEQESDFELYVRLSEPIDVAMLSDDTFSADGVTPYEMEPTTSAAEIRIRFATVVGAGQLLAVGLRDPSGNVAAAHSVAIARAPRPGDIVLNEIMYEPVTDLHGGMPTQPEYIELYNRSDRLVALRGIELAESVDWSGSGSGMLLTESRIGLEANRFLVVYESSGLRAFGSSAPPEFASFGAEAGADALWLPVRTVTTRGLSNSGQDVVLFGRAGAIIDAAAYVPDWHSATLTALSETEGVALERRSTAAVGSAGNWTSSRSASGGTPGRRNSIQSSAPPEPGETAGLTVSPSPFAPDGDGQDGVAEIEYRLVSEAAMARIAIYDLDGRLVRRLPGPTFTGRTGTVLWDGRDEAGRLQPTGILVVHLEAVSAETARAEQYKTLITIVRP